MFMVDKNVEIYVIIRKKLYKDFFYVLLWIRDYGGLYLSFIKYNGYFYILCI